MTSVAPTAVERFVDDMRAAFTRAANGDPSTRTYSVAGRAVTVRAAGDGLLDGYLAAVGHLATDATAGGGTPPNLAVHVWERASTGVAPPPPPWSVDDFLAHGRIRGHAAARIRVTYDEGSRTVTVYDASRAEAFVHVADLRTVAAWVTRSPVRNVLTWWASDVGLAFMHAAAVADERGAVVLAGASGSGKSTTALACFRAGYRLLGDDACIVDLEPAVPVVHPVYGFAKLEPDALARLPELGALVVDPDADQLLLALPHRNGLGVPLRALLLARLSASGAHESELRPVSRRDALRALVPGSLLEGDGAGGTTLGALTRLVRAAPCWRLELGDDTHGVVEAVGRSGAER